MRQQQRVLTMLALLFAAPLALAWLAYLQGNWQPRQGVQHGELLLPLQPLAATALRNFDGTPFDASLLQGRWTLLYRSGEPCRRECRQQLNLLQHIRLAQGVAMARVQRLLVLPVAPAAAEADELRSGGHDLHIVTARQWPLPAGWLYLLDPHGNLVMRYPPGFAPHGVLQDLQRLLRTAEVS